MIQIKREFYSNLRNIENYKQICKLESLYFQHGTTTVYKHSRNVAYYSLLFAKFLERKFNIRFNYDSLIMGAFLHDMFLYDWHEKDASHKWHGYKHPIVASNNAKKMCHANTEVTSIIESHMWPLTITKIPKTREAFVVCLIDKFLAIHESFCIIRVLHKYNSIRIKIINELFYNKGK